MTDHNELISSIFFKRLTALEKLPQFEWQSGRPWWCPELPSCRCLTLQQGAPGCTRWRKWAGSSWRSDPTRPFLALQWQYGQREWHEDTAEGPSSVFVWRSSSSYRWSSFYWWGCAGRGRRWASGQAFRWWWCRARERLLWRTSAGPRDTCRSQGAWSKSEEGERTSSPLTRGRRWWSRRWNVELPAAVTSCRLWLQASVPLAPVLQLRADFGRTVTNTH